MGLGGGGRGDVVEKAIYANEEGKACVEGSAAADGTFEDRGGERSIRDAGVEASIGAPRCQFHLLG